MCIDKSHRIWLAVVLHALLQLSRESAGQGFKPSPRVAGANSLDYARLQQQYKQSQAWRQSYKLNPATACRAGRGNLCAAAEGGDRDAYAQLVLATSPQIYSSIDTTDTGGLRLVATPGDQTPCDTCCVFAARAAAETAMAAVQRVNVEECSISVQALFFCPPEGQPKGSCSGGTTVSEVLDVLQKYTWELPTAACQGYKPDPTGDMTPDVQCTRSCSTPNRFMSQGTFSQKRISTVWEAQRHIRQYGSVVTRFEIMDDFKSFFKNRANAKAVYTPAAAAQPVEPHAVVLVGYNNADQYWIAKNSWGTDWADGGYFKVAYGVCSILTPDTDEAFGVVWQPYSTPAAAKLVVSPGPKDRAGCYWYQALAGDYMSKVARLAGIPLTTFMIENAAIVKDLDATIVGTNLLVCDPVTGTYVVNGPVSSDNNLAAGDPQLHSLLQIKAAIDINNHLQDWTAISGANFGYCKWRGVDCVDNKVTSISLAAEDVGEGLHGTLPAVLALSGLQGLSMLDISSHPGIVGTISSDWSHLGSLSMIAVSNNSLTGTIPSAWSVLTTLDALYLWGNKLSGQLPASWQALRWLTALGLGSNELTGTIPSSWSSLSKLESLHLYYNKLSGHLPDSFKALSSMADLDLSMNQLSGTVPASWSSMSKLESIDLFDNYLGGELPASWQALRLLKELSLGDNHFTGTIPASWGNLPLQSATFQRNQNLGGACRILGPTRNSTSWTLPAQRSQAIADCV